MSIPLEDTYYRRATRTGTQWLRVRHGRHYLDAASADLQLGYIMRVKAGSHPRYTFYAVDLDRAALAKWEETAEPIQKVEFEEQARAMMKTVHAASGLRDPYRPEPTTEGLVAELQELGPKYLRRRYRLPE